jgi:hypothetical protein
MGWGLPLSIWSGRHFSMDRAVAQKHLVAIFGAIFGFLLIIGVGYYLGYSSTWDNYRRQPKIGAEPIKMKLVMVVKDIPAGQAIDDASIEERHELLPAVSLDAYSFASEVLGRKCKWTLNKGQYISRHDVLPTIEGKDHG